MDDRSLYQAILGLSKPWSVKNVELRLHDGEVRIAVEVDAEAALQCPECRQVAPPIEHLRKAGLKVGRAWAIKESATRLWTYKRPSVAKAFFARWFRWATHSRLPSMVRAAKTLKHYLYGILAFTRHPYTNARTEAINAKIQEIKYRARGYRNRENFRMAILFHCGGLQMDPR